MPINDDSMELVLSYCDTGQRGGIDFHSFVKHFEANGRGWFNPFNPNRRLPSPPFRPRRDQTSAAFGTYPPSPSGRDRRLDTAPLAFPRDGSAGFIAQGQPLAPDINWIDTSARQRNHRTEQRRSKVRFSARDRRPKLATPSLSCLALGVLRFKRSGGVRMRACVIQYRSQSRSEEAGSDGWMRANDRRADTHAWVCGIRQARRRFHEYDQARKRLNQHAVGNSTPRNTTALLEVDYMAVVAANVHRERDSMVPLIC